MPDDVPPLDERREQRRLATEEALGFIMARIADFRRAAELIRFRVRVALGLSVLALIGLRMWTRWVWECSLL